MISKKAVAALVVFPLVLAACGGPDHPKPPPPGQGQKPITVTPPPPASIHLRAKGKSGMMLDVRVACGSTASLVRCARVTKSILRQAASMKGGSNKGGQGKPKAPQAKGK